MPRSPTRMCETCMRVISIRNLIRSRPWVFGRRETVFHCKDRVACEKAVAKWESEKNERTEANKAKVATLQSGDGLGNDPETRP